MDHHHPHHSFKLIVGVFVFALLAAFAFPNFSTGQRTVTVTGTGTVTAAPDQFVFTPSYTKDGDSSTAALSAVSSSGNEVVTKLKSLGVKDSDLTTNVSTNQNYSVEPMPMPLSSKTPSGYQATYTITVTVHQKEVAQSIVDYLATTPATDSVSPSSTFSTATRTKLESQARTAALADARTKAEQTASELSAHLGKVVSVSDLSQTSGPIPYVMGEAAPATRDTTTTPILETGSQDFSFSVTVKYSLR